MMLECKEAVDLLVDFLENNLSPHVRNHLVAHFKECDACEQFVASYKKTTYLCREALLQNIPAEMGARLTTFLRDHCK